MLPRGAGCDDGFSRHAAVRLSWEGHEQPVRDTLTKPLPTGHTELALTPLGLLDRLAALRARDPPDFDTGLAFDPTAPAERLRDRSPWATSPVLSTRLTPPRAPSQPPITARARHP